MYQKRRLKQFERFLEKRAQIIEEYDNKKISKEELVARNYDLIRRINVSPFASINSFEKGMYNYQYYNTFAKHYRALAREEKMGKNQKRKINTYQNKCDHYYRLKDLTSLKLLEFLGYKNIRAYFIKTESKRLKDELFEIVLCDYDKAVFHSKSQKLLENLRSAGVFEEKIQKSVIADYINERY